MTRTGILACTLSLCSIVVGCAGGKAGYVGAASVPEPAGADRYDTAVPAAAEAAQPEGLARTIRQGVAPADLERDPRLDRVAARLLEVQPLSAPQARVIDALMREVGLVEPVPIVSAASGTRAGAADLLSKDLRKSLTQRELTHYGFAVREDPVKGAAAVVVLSSRRLQLEPVPRSVPVGTALALRGTVADGLRDPRWVVTPPEGDVERLPPAEGSGFDTSVSLPSAGVYRLELIADGGAGVTVVANFPVWVGQAPPPVRLGPGRAEGPPPQASEVERRLRELIGRERRAAGRPVLEDDAALDAVALAHCQDMRDHDFVAHTSPRTGAPVDRLREAGLSAWLVRENIGRGYSAEEIHEGLMESPGHRDNILSTEAEQLGLAVVEIPEKPRPAFLATELFVSLARPVDVGQARKRVLSHIADTREAAGARRVKEDAGLRRAAQAAAERFFRERVDQNDLLSTAVQGAPLPAGSDRIGGGMFVLEGLGQLTQSPIALPPGTKRMGVGVAQGQREDTAPHALAVVLLYAL